MDKPLTRNSLNVVIAFVFSFLLSACVTQNFENGEKPVVQNQSNLNDMAVTRISLGLGYLKMGNMPQAKQNLEKAKRFAPDMVQVYTAFAHYYETVGEHELTVQSYEKALSLNSEDADTLNNYGVYLCRQGQTNQAEKQFLKAIAVPTYLLVSKSYENLSSCFLEKDDFVKAEQYLNKAILHSPSDASILLQMVRLQYAMGNYPQAKMYEQRFEKYTRRFSPQSLALAYKVHLKLGQRRTAKNYGTMLVEMYPQSWEAKQYVLNELELIEADNLAKRYQLTQVSKSHSKKRVVKLSPKSSHAKTNIEKPTKKLLANSEKAAVVSMGEKTSQPASKTMSNNVVTTPSNTNNLATSASVSAALSMTPNINVSQSDKKTVKKINNADEKRVIVMSAPTKATDAEQASVNTSVKEVPQSEILLAESALAKGAVNQDIPLEDQEIQHVAKKPQPIVESKVEQEAYSVVGMSKNKYNEKAISKEPSLEKASTAKVADKKQTVTKQVKSPAATHIVKKGDTLYSISMKYNVKMKAIMRWNHLSKSKKLHIKDKIFVEDPNSGNSN